MDSSVTRCLLLPIANGLKDGAQPRRLQPGRDEVESWLAAIWAAY